MPIYEYACKNCGYTLDELQKINDQALVDCPECGQPQLKRLISAPRFRLKGAGWYETDFKKDNQRNLSKGEGDATSGGVTSDASGSEKSNGAKSEGKAEGEKSSATTPVEKSTDTKPAAAKAAERKPAASKPAASKPDASKSD
jgi:putative FmdB family regulatory protein